MKKIILPLLFSFISLFSCNKSKEDILEDKINIYKLDKSSITYNKKVITFYNYLNKEDIKKIIKYKEDAFIYIYAPNCSNYCGVFKPVLETKIYQENLLINYTEIGIIKTVDEFKDLEVESQLLLIRNGKLLKTTIVDENNPKTFLDNYFSSYLNIKNTKIANNLYYQNSNIEHFVNTALLYTQINEESNYTLFNSLESYLDKDKVLLINRNKYNFESFYNYQTKNDIQAIYYLDDDIILDNKYNLDIQTITSGYLTKDNDKYSYQSLTFSSIS